MRTKSLLLVPGMIALFLSAIALSLNGWFISLEFLVFCAGTLCFLWGTEKIDDLEFTQGLLLAALIILPSFFFQ